MQQSTSTQSVTCIAWELMEHIIASHIMSYLKRNNILCQEQHCFRHSWSCETQILGYVDETTEEMEYGNQEDIIAFDFSKAFDKVSHTLLVHKI